MPTIRIHQVPTGFEPEFVRQAWQGLVFDDARRMLGQPSLRIGRTDLAGWVLPAEDVFGALQEASPRAYAWWDEHFPNAMLGRVSFAIDLCEVVPAN